jgi:hypothetical protein
MTYLKNIFVGLAVLGIFALHPSLNKGESPATYLQYLIYGNSLDVSFNSSIDINLLQIKWVCETEVATCSDLLIYENGKQINKIPFEKGSQKLVVFYDDNRIGEISQNKLIKKQSHQYKINLLAKNNSLFFNGEIIGPAPYKGPSITIPSLVSL